MQRATPEQIDELRAVVAKATNAELDAFLSSHALATIAAHLIEQMPPEARTAFFAQMRREWPTCFPGPWVPNA